jgi:hypothetical protein
VQGGYPREHGSCQSSWQLRANRRGEGHTHEGRKEGSMGRSVAGGGEWNMWGKCPIPIREYRPNKMMRGMGHERVEGEVS